MKSILLGFLVASLLSQQAVAHQGKNLEKADEMIRCMVYLLKYKYDDFHSAEEKAEEAKKYEDLAISLSSNEHFNTRLLEVDEQLMMENMAAIGKRTGKETVDFYDGLIGQCRIKQAEYQTQS